MGVRCGVQLNTISHWKEMILKVQKIEWEEEAKGADSRSLMSVLLNSIVYLGTR